MSKKVATIGFFDGVHRGHQFLCQQLKTLAGADGATMVVTFDVHPQQIVGRHEAPQLLTSNAEKTYFLESLCGIDDVVFLGFTAEIAGLSAFEFMKTYLHERFGVTHLLIGYDHHFGRLQFDAAGQRIPEGFADYQRYGREIGIEVVQARELPAEQRVSSSTIRRLIADGDVETANSLLGYTFRISGTVVSGHQVGRTMGFPTANLQPIPGFLLPAPGVYVTMARVSGRDFPAVTNIGHRPTLDNGQELSVESHFLGVERLPSLYDEHISLDFHQRLRSEQRFPSLDALKQQITADVEAASRWHREHSSIY